MSPVLIKLKEVTMIRYQCICGSAIEIGDNTEETREFKKGWKKKHDQKVPGHKWQRLIAKKKKEA